MAMPLATPVLRPDRLEFRLRRASGRAPGHRQFIGELDIGGSRSWLAFIRTFIDGCWPPVRHASSPIPIRRITRAVRAFEKAGFEKVRMVDTPDGPALLMVRNA